MGHLRFSGKNSRTVNPGKVSDETTWSNVFVQWLLGILPKCILIPAFVTFFVLKSLMGEKKELPSKFFQKLRCESTLGCEKNISINRFWYTYPDLMWLFSEKPKKWEVAWIRHSVSGVLQKYLISLDAPAVSPENKDDDIEVLPRQVQAKWMQLAENWPNAPFPPANSTAWILWITSLKFQS